MFENMTGRRGLRMGRWARLCLARRFVRNKKGATAVEFGLVVLPFFLILFMIIETAIVFFAGQTLETAVADSARLILTGQAQTAKFDAAAFKNSVCGKVYGLFDCASSMYVDVKTYNSFSSINNTIQYDADGKPQTSYSPGNPGDIVVVRLIYQWPIIVPMVQTWLANSGGNTRLLVATAAFRNEPYTN
jgi:Flp pilus assembly protein TadG